ncbi:Bgt-88 [Blumeria graminis f. sp. tritici]|uniref:Bgt-88 n=2 Tax=Blumeria graminis f. sp. tritici TaxID=62690 RepID=A0A381LHV5_BLUGR|nr:subunit of the transport protein particle (TRAPP) complex of the cis-Golgi [Blumeria graminis f. sp. tritici 96224]VDB84321.1 Bgt-88 [Blumeria graminis f. sp. tritici]
MSVGTNQSLANALDSSATFLNLSCLDFLMIELVPMMYRVVNDVDSTAPEERAAKQESKNVNTDEKVSYGKSGSTTGTINVQMKQMEEDDEKDAVFFRLEALGYRVGQGLVERFSRERQRFIDTLDVIKFICKDLWQLLFKKQLDNLKTNHRGVYVLTDHSFRPFARMSTEAGGQAVIRAQPYLWFPCGIIRGALANMGIDATVQAETSELPGAIFQIKSNTKF